MSVPPTLTVTVAVVAALFVSKPVFLIKIPLQLAGVVAMVALPESVVVPVVPFVYVGEATDALPLKDLPKSEAML
jgi:hypothetical protein